MSVAAQDPFTVHTANGVATVYAYQFRIARASDLVVELGGITYPYATISGVGDSGGGTVIFPSAPANGVQITLRRSVPLARSNGYTQGGPFPAPTVDLDFDLLWMALQQLDAYRRGMLRAPFPESLDAMPSLAARQGRLLAFNSSTGQPEATSFTQTQVASAIAAAYSGAAGPVDALSFIQAGTGAVSRTAQEKLRESISAADFGAVGDGVTDDLPALQAAIDYAIDNGLRRVEIGPGDFIINGTLQIKGTLSAYKSLELRGATGAFIGETRLVHHSTQKTNPLLAVQASRSVRVVDLRIDGNNVAPTDLAQLGNGAFVNSDRADWITSGIQDTRHAPYCGIAIDALTGADPGAGANYTFGSYGQTSSSKLLFERVRVMNFLAGAAVGPRNSDSGTEDIVFRDCTFVENVYQVVTTGSQQRSVIVQDCNAGGHWCNFDNVTYGTRTGQPIQIRGALINKSHRLFQTSTDIGNMLVENLYCESVASMGIIGTGSSSAFLGASFQGCVFSFIGLDDDGTFVNKDEVLKVSVPVEFTGCSFVAQFQFPMSLQRPAVFDTCQFRCMGTALDTTPGEQENFLIAVPEGQEHRVIMRNCDQRVYSLTTKLLDNEPRVYTLPVRAFVMPHTTRVVQVSNKSTYKMGSTNVTKNATVSGVTYNSAEQISFTETTSPAIIMEGDVLDWQVLVPTLPGAAAETAILPALRVTDVTAGVVTCKVTGRLDTTYSPATVRVRVRQFINGTTATGDTTNGDDDIINVTNASNFRVGDWIKFSDTGVFSSELRILAIVGTTITVDRNLSKTTMGVSIFNSLLTAM